VLVHATAHVLDLDVDESLGPDPPHALVDRLGLQAAAVADVERQAESVGLAEVRGKPLPVVDAFDEHAGFGFKAERHATGLSFDDHLFAAGGEPVPRLVAIESRRYDARPE
jgi:hypothetical protein